MQTLNRVTKMFPRLAETRFRNSVDLYTLFMLVWELERQGAVLTDRKRNREAEALLVSVSNGVDEVREQIRKARGASPTQKVFADYVLTIRGDTDSHATRHRRAAIIRPAPRRHL